MLGFTAWGPVTFTTPLCERQLYKANGTSIKFTVDFAVDSYQKKGGGGKVFCDGHQHWQKKAEIWEG